jgi:hypothetical protein
MYTRLAVVIFALVMITACGAVEPDGSPGGANGSGNNDDVTTSPKIVAEQTRSGGFAGIEEQLTVYADGTLELERRGSTQTAQGDAAAIQALRATVSSAEWSQLDSEYGKPVPDGYTYTVEAGGKTVTTYDGADFPEPLATAMQQLDELYGTVTAAR